MGYEATGLLGPLSAAELAALDARMRDAQFTVRQMWPVSEQGLWAEIVDVRREVNAVFPWGA